MFVCEACGGSAKTVMDSRPSQDGYIRRRRKCACGARITTIEIRASVLEELQRRVPTQLREVHEAVSHLAAKIEEALPSVVVEAPSGWRTGSEPSQRNIEITRRYDAGEGTLSELGAEYGVSGSRIQQIVHKVHAWLAEQNANGTEAQS